MIVGNQRRNPDWNQRSGSSLVMALVVVLALVAVSASFFQVSSSITRRQMQAIDQKKAFYLAEAGLAESYVAIRIGKTGVIGSMGDPAIFGDGLFWVEVEEHENGLYTLRSTGMVGSARTVLSIVIEEGDTSVAALGLFSSLELTIPPGTLIDSYESGAGAYTPPGGGGGGGGGDIGEEYEIKTEGVLTLYADIGNRAGARVSSNSDITIQETPSTQTRVFGDLRPGKDQDLIVVGTPTVTGSTTPLAVPVGLPTVQVPTVDQEPGITHSGGTPLVLPPGTKSYEHLIVSTSSSVTIQGPATLVLEDLSVVEGAELVLDTTGGQIRLFITDELSLAAGSYLTQTGTDPRQLVIQVASDETAEFHGEGALYGLVFAPLAEISLGGGMEFFGSLVGSSVDFEGAAKLHFDLTLADWGEENGIPHFAAWRIVVLAANETPSGDPFKALGVIPALLRSPADAHVDQWLDLEYYDRTGRRNL